jgi:hypothetical protein
MSVRIGLFEHSGLGGTGKVSVDRDDSGVDRAEFDWALHLNTWIWGVGCLQQADRHLSGSQRSVDLAMVGRRVVEVEADLLELMS